MPYTRTALLLIAFFIVTSASAKEDAPFPPAPGDVSSVATLVGASEPGEKLVITGRVFKKDVPYPDFILYLYQTDATGRYNSTDGNWQRPRIHGWLKTDAEGKYEIRTIKPGSYPRGRNPAHIHVIVKLPGRTPRWLDDFLFEGDPYLDPRDKGRHDREGDFSPVMRIEKDPDGTMRCKRNIVIP
jgi:protocatechuate 3,4-dioxygenase beta subunit